MGSKTKAGMILWTAMVFVLLGLVGSMRASGEEGVMKDPKAGSEKGKKFDVIVIDNPDYDRDRKGPVIFSHRKHALDYKILCWDCHHEYNSEGVNEWSPWADETQQCKECHDANEEIDDVMKLQTAYHINCKNCHKTMAKEGKKTGPYRKCLECHEKK
ncbi:MAG: cytochrome c3 family protein [Deltaproteobacteria bacterium]|nr:cytochrome c3 family protein [Deltaproteobacteria bacterium]